MTPTFVLDCSVTMSWCFEDETSPYADSVLHSLKTTKAIVPTLWFLEISNVLLMAERKRRINEGEIIHFIHLLNRLPIETDRTPQSILDLTLLGRSHQLTSYDTCYLGLALSYGLPLATLDEKLKLAAIKAGVGIYNPV